MSRKWQIPRRTFLRGAGAAIALPWLDVMSTASSFSAETNSPPQRMVFVYLPNGLEMEYFTPATEGKDFELPRILKPLEKFRGDFSVLSGLDNSEPGHGGGDTWLTQVKLDATPGFVKKNYISVDQLAAQKLGQETRFPSLELTGALPGDSTAYARSLAWSRDGIPIAGESSVRAVFDRLFRDESEAGVGEELRRLRRKKSILDAVMAPAKKLKGNLGLADRKKLDEYLTSVREVEKQIQRAEEWATKPKPKTNGKAPAADPEPSRSRGEFMRAIFDMMVLAFQTDSTRVASLMTAREAANAVYTEVGSSDGHHSLSHWTTETQKQKFIDFNRLDIFQLAYLLDRLKSVKEGARSLLDSSMVVCGSAMHRSGHSPVGVPLLLAGHGGGKLKQGQHVRFADGTPLANLMLTMLQQVGIEEKSFGVSTGSLNELKA